MALALARTSPPPVSTSSAADGDRQVLAQRPGVAPGRAFLGGPALEPREVPTNDGDVRSFLDELLERHRITSERTEHRVNQRPVRVLCQRGMTWFIT